MRLGIVGSRRRNKLSDKILIRKKVKELNPLEIVSGGCKQGADRFAEQITKELRIKKKIFLPEKPKRMVYHEFVKAFFSRNKQIAEYSDMLIALVAPDRKGGTENTIKHFLKTHNEIDLILL